MKACAFLFRGCAALLLISAMFAARGLQAAPSRNARPTSPATNAVPVEIPQSVFVNPSTPSEGRDPFFPKSLRPYSAGPSKAKNNSEVAALVLNGLSGTPESRLAMINGHTFAQGETAEVSTSSGRVTIRCIQISDDTVVVEIGGERRELRLRRGL